MRRHIGGARPREEPVGSYNRYFRPVGSEPRYTSEGVEPDVVEVTTWDETGRLRGSVDYATDGQQSCDVVVHVEREQAQSQWRVSDMLNFCMKVTLCVVAMGAMFLATTVITPKMLRLLHPSPQIIGVEINAISTGRLLEYRDQSIAVSLLSLLPEVVIPYTDNLPDTLPKAGTVVSSVDTAQTDVTYVTELPPLNVATSTLWEIIRAMMRTAVTTCALLLIVGMVLTGVVHTLRDK